MGKHFFFYGQITINDAYDFYDAIVVASAGNEGSSDKQYPAAYDHVVAVASTDRSDIRAFNSNFGSWVDVSAPGVEIVSTVLNHDYDTLWGTSMACPLVAGLCGLIRSVNKDLSYDEVVDILLNTADNIDARNPGFIGKLGSSRANSQESKLCGTYLIDTLAINNALRFEKNKGLNKAGAGGILMRVYFHIIRNDDGSNAAATLVQLDDEYKTLFAAYAPDNICFLNAGFDYVDNTYLNSTFDANEDKSSLFDPYRVVNCLNIFYSMQINGNNPSCGLNCTIGGTSFKIPSTFCLISAGNIGAGQTIAHEAGHCMGLLHTFEPVYGYEEIDGTNAASPGDLISDTQADPYAYRTQSCFSTSMNSCIYTGSCKDPDGKSSFSPPYSNLMGYWWPNNCYPSLSLTGDQYARVNAVLSTDADLLNCQSSENITFINLNLSSGCYIQSAVNTLATGNSVIISGTAKATLGGGEILIKPGFHGAPANGGLILLKLKSCGLPKEVTVARDTKDLKTFGYIKKNKIINSSSLVAYPIATSSLVNLTFDIAQKENNVAIKVYDVNGRLVKEIPMGNILPGKHKLVINFNHFNNGIYAVTL